MKNLFLSIFLISSLFGGTYDYNYKLDVNKSVSPQKKDMFMYGNFSEIIRFDMLQFTNNDLRSIDTKKFQKIVDKINEYKNDHREMLIKVIGHTNERTDDYNEMLVDSKTYANKIQNLFRPTFDKNTTLIVSENYALYVEDKLINADINKSLITVEYRGGQDMAFSDETCDGKEASNRVMVTIYLYPKKELDSDKDGVLDSIDKCPNTLEGIKVDKKGCPLDSDKDGVFDHNDSCPNTPIDVKVDMRGCPLDSDGDGILDYKDRCPDTPQGLMVDPKGCPRNKNLELYFKTGSDVILKKSYTKIEEFAKFMDENPAYHAEIIGHTDSQGKASKNMKLSKDRAASTKVALVSAGVESSRLSTSGRGELDPLQTNRTKAGRKANRRIEVKLSLKNN